MRLHKQAAAVALACLVVFIACYSAVGMQNDVLEAGGATGASRTSTALAANDWAPAFVWEQRGRLDCGKSVP